VKETLFPKSRFRGVAVKIGKAGVATVCEFAADFTPALARVIGGTHLFDQSGVPRADTAKTELSTAINGAEMGFAVKGMTKAETHIVATEVGKFVVFSSGGKKRGKAASVGVKFKATLSASRDRVIELLDFLTLYGGAEGTLTMTHQADAQMKLGGKPGRPKAESQPVLKGDDGKPVLVGEAAAQHARLMQKKPN
jgi:hypothetical protein